jgi:hypothetical protein
MVAQRSPGGGSSAPDFRPEIGDSAAETKPRQGVGVDLPAFYAGPRTGPFKLEE